MDEKIEKAVKKLIEMYSEIEMGLLERIASHFDINEEFLNSDYWRINKLEELGLFNEEVIEYIASYSGKTNVEVKRALNQIGIDTVDINKLRGLFEDGILRIDPKRLEDNYIINQLINKSYNELTNRFVEIGNIIEQSTRQAYLNVIEEAYIKTSMGTHSYQEAIRESIDKLSNKGITAATYLVETKNGQQLRTYDIEGIVRRDVLLSSRKLNAEISMEVANQMESEYVYISEHLDCRPEHFDWQGTVIKREDLTKPLPTYPEYGSEIGLCGINCRHYFEPYWGDPKEVKKEFTKEECADKYYETQHQRYLERGVRKWKRRTNMSKASNDKKVYKFSKGKLKEWQGRLDMHTEIVGAQMDYTREYISK